MKKQHFILTAIMAAGLSSCEGESLKTSPAEIKGYKNEAIAIFAGGCFWCMEPPFENRAGVYEAVSGYTGGSQVNPTYKQVGSGGTGHTEAVRVQYDSSLITYQELLDIYWKSMNPTDTGGQFADRGSPYKPVIFYGNEDERKQAEQSKATLNAAGTFTSPVIVPIRPAVTFYPAEEYHQDYYQKNPDHYYGYRKGSGREGFLIATWGYDISHPKTYSVPSDAELIKTLTTLQYNVTRKNATEPPFNNEYWNNDSAGIYVDIISGEPLFASIHQFHSGTGWPSFTQPLVPANVKEVKDESLGMARTEVRSVHADSHLGHLFDDGPDPTGLRYCINSASLKFISKARMADQGYGVLSYLFESK